MIGSSGLFGLFVLRDEIFVDNKIDERQRQHRNDRSIQSSTLVLQESLIAAPGQQHGHREAQDHQKDNDAPGPDRQLQQMKKHLEGLENEITHADVQNG